MCGQRDDRKGFVIVLEMDGCRGAATGADMMLEVMVTTVGRCSLRFRANPARVPSVACASKSSRAHPLRTEFFKNITSH